MKIIKQTYHINAAVADVWKALVDRHEIENWGGGPVKMDGKKGTEFSLWGGSIWGKNVKVVPEKVLVQEWFSEEDGKWDKASIVTFTLKKMNNGTQVDLLHEDVPDQYAKNIADGWRGYYLGPLKGYLQNK